MKNKYKEIEYNFYTLELKNNSSISKIVCEIVNIISNIKCNSHQVKSNNNLNDGFEIANDFNNRFDESGQKLAHKMEKTFILIILRFSEKSFTLQ